MIIIGEKEAKGKKITIIIEDQPSRGDPLPGMIERISGILWELWKWLKPWPGRVI